MEKGKPKGKAPQVVATPALPAYMKEAGNNVMISFLVKPNAKITQLTALAAPPREGEANQELLDFVCGFLSVKKSEVSLCVGGKSRTKVVQVQGITSAKVLASVQSAI